MSDRHDWMAGMTDFQRAEVARLESRIVSFEKRWQSLEADWNDCKKALAAAKDELSKKVGELAAAKKRIEELEAPIRNPLSSALQLEEALRHMKQEGGGA